MLTATMRQLPRWKVGWGRVAPKRRRARMQGLNFPPIWQFSGKPGEGTCQGKSSLSILLQCWHSDSNAAGAPCLLEGGVEAGVAELGRAREEKGKKQCLPWSSQTRCLLCSHSFKITPSLRLLPPEPSCSKSGAICEQRAMGWGGKGR